jgi:hypothetical protein
MPRTLVWAPHHQRDRSLGWLAVEWMEHFVVHGRGDAAGLPIVHGDEYTGFVVDCLALDETGRMLYDSAFLSRPKGTDKSGLGARFALWDAFGPCRFAGFARGGEVYEDPWGLGFRYVYKPGDPMGRPVHQPFIRILATEEGQTDNVYESIYYNLTDGDAPLSGVGADAGLTRIYLPGGGEIRPCTASSAAKDGGLETFVVFDETHLYVTPELKRMYKTVTRNLRKRKKTAGGTWFLETTTMFAPGEESVAEKTYDLAEAIADKRARRQRLMLDHRWGECEDLSKADQLRAAIREAFGEAIGWNDVESIVDEFYDTRNDPADSRRYFLNARTPPTGAWVDSAKWGPCADATKVVADGERVTLGFDGSIDEDSTALVGCRVSDGHLFLIDCWEKPFGPAGQDWRVDTEAVDQAVALAMAKYEVVGFYADPAHWQSYLDRWQEKYGRRMRVKATQARPLEWWTSRPIKMVNALKRLHDAVAGGEVTHDGGAVLTRHVLNARRRLAGKVGVTICKEHPKSTRKIDAAMAATLAYECRGDAIAMGLARLRKHRRSAGI